MLPRVLYFLLLLMTIACLNNDRQENSLFEIPTVDHDLGFIPFEKELDDANYVICDSTEINSGRNRVQYIGGNNKFRQDIESGFTFKKSYALFNGYIVLRFMVNCEGDVGRYRARALNIDFSPSSAPSDLVNHSVDLIKSLDNWTKREDNDEREYSKFINLKFNNGKIQHILL